MRRDSKFRREIGIYQEENRNNFGKRNAANGKRNPERRNLQQIRRCRGKIEIEAIGKHGDFAGIHFPRCHRGNPLIEGIFGYSVGNKPISAGHTKTAAYVDGDRKLDAGFGVKGSQEFAETDAPAPKVQLQIIMVLLGVIA